MSKKSSKKNARKCGKCGRTGHYRKTCKYKTKVAKKSRNEGPLFTEVEIEAMIERAVKKALMEIESDKRKKAYTQRRQQTCPRCKGTGIIYIYEGSEGQTWSNPQPHRHK